MILGISTQAFTLLHVIISLLAIVSGVAVLCGLLADQLYRRWNSLFLVTASLTSITGFAFPKDHITPGIVVGVLSLIALILATVALHLKFPNRAYRGTFVASTTVAVYFGIFVLIAQLFQHIALLKALDATGDGPIFDAVQLLVLVIFTWLGVTAFRSFTVESFTGSQITAVHPPPMQSQSE